MRNDNGLDVGDCNSRRREVDRLNLSLKEERSELGGWMWCLRESYDQE